MAIYIKHTIPLCLTVKLKYEIKCNLWYKYIYFRVNKFLSLKFV